MQVKFKYGVKSFSGTLDDHVYANYEDRGVVIGRMKPKKTRINSSKYFNC